MLCIMSTTVKSHIRSPPLAAQHSPKGLTESSNATVFTMILELYIYIYIYIYIHTHTHTHTHTHIVHSFLSLKSGFRGGEGQNAPQEKLSLSYFWKDKVTKRRQGRLAVGGGRGHSRKSKKCPERELGRVGYVPGLCSNLSLGCLCEHDRSCLWRVCRGHVLRHL